MDSALTGKGPGRPANAERFLREPSPRSPRPSYGQRRLPEYFVVFVLMLKPYSSRRFSFAVFLLASVGAFAQIQGPGQYFQRPGVQEFSGEMIVRPVQASALNQARVPQGWQTYIQARARQRLLPFTKEYVAATDEYVIRIPAGENENTMSARLMATGDYQYAEPNWFCYPLRTPNDPRYGQQWHHPVVKSPQAWDLVTGSAAVTVAVVDTGIDTTHPDLAPNRVPGYNSVDRKAEVDGGQVNDINGHGTHVAGDAAAIGNNGVGVCGMGWNFRIMMVRTSNSPGGGASIADITAGARWAADNGAKSVSASYGGVDSATVGTTGTYIKTKGALFLYAAGNDNRDLANFSHADTIVVGASDQGDRKASFSAYGRGVHVFAPGVNILSTTRGGGYGEASGTSMATPVANGVVALIYAANPSLTADQVMDALESTCDNIGSSAIFGKGRINAFKAVQKALTLQQRTIAPTSITTREGTWLRGTVADVVLPNTGRSYDIESRKIPLGEVATYECTFPSGTTRSRVYSLKFSTQNVAVPNTLVTGMMYAWNFNTGAWELLSQFLVPSTGSTIHQKTIESNPGRFVGGSGEVRTMIRTVSTTRGGGLPPLRYELKARYAGLAVGALP